MMNLSDVALILNCNTVPTALIHTVSIDSRKCIPGSLYIALQGSMFDGHDFIQEAEDRGAVGVICERFNPSITIPQLVVSNSQNALGYLAKWHRQQMNCPVIAVTGSNGKTTVKEMIAAILPVPSLATSGNFNNHIGAPLSVLNLQPEHRYAVFELGANHLGEIAYTAAIVKPDVAVINNIASAHIAEFGSQEAIAKAKGEIYQSLSSKGCAVINADDNYAHYWDNLLNEKRVVRYSMNHAETVHADCIRFDKNNRATFNLHLESLTLEITLKVPGQHSIANALAAASATYALGIDSAAIQQGLMRFNGVGGRMSYLQGKNQAVIIDDTYNANLNSVLAAIEVLAQCSGKRVLVLGDLGELGEWTQEHHETIGHKALEKGIDQVLTCGKQSQYTSKSFGVTAKHYTNQDKLAYDLLNNLDENTTVLVKGSRSAQMEKIVHQLVG